MFLELNFICDIERKNSKTLNIDRNLLNKFFNKLSEVKDHLELTAP